MSIFSNNLEKSTEKSDNVLQETIAGLLKDFMKEFVQITEFSKNEIKALSLIENDKHLSKMVKYYNENKKHVNRVHASELLTLIKNLVEALKNIQPSMSLGGSE